jgi:hypothetical protein
MVNVYDKGYPEGVMSMETLFLSYKERVINKVRKIFKLDHKTLTDERYHFYELDEKKIYYTTRQFLKKSGIKPDAIIILFAHKIVNAKNIFELSTRAKAPVYWMMYDSAPLTGAVIIHGIARGTRICAVVALAYIPLIHSIRRIKIFHTKRNILIKLILILSWHPNGNTDTL